MSVQTATIATAFAGAATAVFALDQMSKDYVREHVPKDRVYDTPVPGLEIYHVDNHAFSLGLLGGLPVPAQLAVAALPMAGAALLGHTLIKGGAHAGLVAAGVGMVIAGGASNGWDRIQQGAVTDFLSPLGLFSNNVADIAVWAGIGVAGLGILASKGKFHL